MIKSEQAAAPTQLSVVLNWFEELKRRAGLVKIPMTLASGTRWPLRDPRADRRWRMGEVYRARLLRFVRGLTGY